VEDSKSTAVSNEQRSLVEVREHVARDRPADRRVEQHQARMQSSSRPSVDPFMMVS
jgi:hypothetical protein